MTAYRPAKMAYTTPMFDADRFSVLRRCNGNVVGIPPKDVDITSAAVAIATNVGFASKRLNFGFSSSSLGASASTFRTVSNALDTTGAARRTSAALTSRGKVGDDPPASYRYPPMMGPISVPNPALTSCNPAAIDTASGTALVTTHSIVTLSSAMAIP